MFLLSVTAQEYLLWFLCNRATALVVTSKTIDPIGLIQGRAWLLLLLKLDILGALARDLLARLSDDTNRFQFDVNWLRVLKVFLIDRTLRNQVHIVKNIITSQISNLVIAILAICKSATIHELLDTSLHELLKTTLAVTPRVIVIRVIELVLAKGPRELITRLALIEWSTVVIILLGSKDLAGSLILRFDLDMGRW